MRKLIAVVALCLMPALTLSGCWSYRSLNDISIVMGLGVDRDSATGNYRISAEIVDLTRSIKESGPGARLIEAEGKTLFDAVRNAKRKLLNRLYFGNMQVMVLGEAVAREVGIQDAADWVMRDAEGRETINLLVLQGGTAHDLLTLYGLDQAILSLEIDSIISEDNKSTSSTVHSELYNVYGVLNCPGIDLTLPAFRIAENDGKKVAEANGVAVFKGDKLENYLTPEASKFFLLATGKAKGGILPMALSGGGAPDTSLEIADSRAKTSCEETDGQMRFRIETETDVYLAETAQSIDVLDPAQIEALEKEAGKRLELEITAVIAKVQREFGADIFGFGEYLHRHDDKKWRRLKDRWSEVFKTLPVTVSCKVNIKNTAFIKSREAICA